MARLINHSNSKLTKLGYSLASCLKVVKLGLQRIMAGFAVHANPIFHRDYHQSFLRISHPINHKYMRQNPCKVGKITLKI